MRETIDRIWPNGIVENSFDPDESYFCRVHPKLSSALRHIQDTHPVSEREPGGGPVWWEESDPEEDPPDVTELERSYHTFFVSPEGDPGQTS